MSITVRSTFHYPREANGFSPEPPTVADLRTWLAEVTAAGVPDEAQLRCVSNRYTDPSFSLDCAFFECDADEAEARRNNRPMRVVGGQQ